MLLGIWELEISACGSVGLEQNLILAAGKKRLKLLFVILIAQSPVDNEYSKIWRDSRQCIAILNCNPFRIRKSKPRLQTRSHVSYDKFWHGTIAARSGILWEKL